MGFNLSIDSSVQLDCIVITHQDTDLIKKYEDVINEMWGDFEDECVSACKLYDTREIRKTVLNPGISGFFKDHYGMSINVFETKGVVVGFTTVALYSKDKLCRIRTRYVKPSERNKGYGKALHLKTLELIKKNEDVEYVMFYNMRPESNDNNMFKTLGYEVYQNDMYLKLENANFEERDVKGMTIDVIDGEGEVLDRNIDAIVEMWQELEDYHSELDKKNGLVAFKHQKITRDDVINDLKDGAPDDLTYLVVRLDDEAVGFITYSRSNEYKSYIVNTYGVRSDFRGRGIGHSLFKEMVDDLKLKHDIENIVLTVISHNLNSVGVYEKYGFTTYTQRFLIKL